MSTGLAQPEKRTVKAGFAATRWSVVLAAGGAEGSQRTEALNTLCRTYWPPLYSFIRFQGHGPQEAKDHTQEFLARLIARDGLAGLSPANGRFRSFLLAALKNHLADARAKDHAVKRGGGQRLVPLDEVAYEESWIADVRGSRSAEEAFDRRWALSVLDRAMSGLQEEHAAAGRLPQFDQLKVFLSREGTGLEYDQVGVRLGMTGGAVAVAVHRLRHRYRDFVHAEVAHTVSNWSDLEDEMRYLVQLITS